MSYIAPLLAVCLLCGCASVKVVPIKNIHNTEGKTLKPDESGVRFYRPALYVWITAAPLAKKAEVGAQNSQKSYSAKIVVLPDFTQEYVIKWKPGLGSVNPNFTLTDGWNLTAFNSTADSKFAETVGSLGTLATGLGALFVDEVDAAGLYRLEVGEGGELKLGDRVVPLPPPYTP